MKKNDWIKPLIIGLSCAAISRTLFNHGFLPPLIPKILHIFNITTSNETLNGGYEWGALFVTVCLLIDWYIIQPRKKIASYLIDQIVKGI
jgi:hypothetical protein